MLVSLLITSVVLLVCALVFDLVLLGVVTAGGMCVEGGVNPAAMQHSAHVDGRSWTWGKSKGVDGKPGGDVRVFLVVLGLVAWGSWLGLYARFVQELVQTVEL